MVRWLGAKFDSGLAGLKSYIKSSFPGFVRHARVVDRGVRRDKYLDEVAAYAATGKVIVVDLVGNTDQCGPRCNALMSSWGKWATDHFRGTIPASEFASALRVKDSRASPRDYFVPCIALAMITVPERFEDYLSLIGPKSRNMIRKAEKKGYEFREFSWNDHLDDIFEINTSKEKRGGRNMSAGYLARPSSHSDEPGYYCDCHRIAYYGCFLENKLVAYCNLQMVGDLAIINTILGHGEHLPNGVMNGLVASMVKSCIERPYVKYINYLTLHSATPELDAFKRRIGLDDYTTFVNARKLRDATGQDFGPGSPTLVSRIVSIFRR